jgi:multidrug efflux pump
MLGVTAFGVFLTPVFYYVIQWFSTEKKADDQEQPNGFRLSPEMDGLLGQDHRNPHQTLVDQS